METCVISDDVVDFMYEIKRVHLILKPVSEGLYYFGKFLVSNLSENLNF